MTPFTIVISDVGKRDAGLRGTRSFWWFASRFCTYSELGLYWFLCEYFGRSQVTLLRPSQLLQGSAHYNTDWLFVGLPTRLHKEHLRRLHFRRMALYDSTDVNGIAFEYSDKAFLLSHTNLCLKNWRDRRWSHDFSVGLLPIKRPPLNNKLRMAFRLASAKRRWGFLPEKKYDVGFVARPTGDIRKNQRVRWLVDLKSQRPHLKLWGGLTGGKQWRQSLEQGRDWQVPESCWMNRRKIGYFEYFAGLCASKVALAPAGWAPWTYRHFEAIYARCIVVSNDLRHFDFLIPFPRDGMVEVPDGETVVHGVDAALALCERSPEIVEANAASLNRWLDAGSYSRDRPDTVDRFFAELEVV
jgi:hypothetical protein